MHRLLQFLSLTAVAITGFAGIASADSDIRCPAGEYNVQITDRVPRDWDVEAGTVRLTDTAIQSRRGPDILQCIYGTAATLEIRAPFGEQCEARRFGFHCVTRRPGRPGGPGIPGGPGWPGNWGPQVVAEGTLRLPQTHTADLDTGRVGGRGNDIWLEAINPIQRFLTPRNGALIAVYGSNPPSFQNCRQAPLTNNRISLIQVLLGTWFCVQTNEGRISRIRVSEMHGIFPITLDLDYITWE